MDDKEQIDTIVSVGAGLPPLNPYLDDFTVADDDTSLVVKNSKKGKSNASKKKELKKPAKNEPLKQVSLAPDPTEYIAELERPEDENILY